MDATATASAPTAAPSDAPAPGDATEDKPKPAARPASRPRRPKRRPVEGQRRRPMKTPAHLVLAYTCLGFGALLTVTAVVIKLLLIA